MSSKSAHLFINTSPIDPDEFLFPGIYRSNGAFNLAQNFTLNGSGTDSIIDDIYIILINGAFSMAANLEIVCINGVEPKNIFWVITGAFSLGAGVNFRGNLLINGDASIGAGCTIHGNVYALKAVSFDTTTINGQNINTVFTSENEDDDLIDTINLLGASNYALISKMAIASTGMTYINGNAAVKAPTFTTALFTISGSLLINTSAVDQYIQDVETAYEYTVDYILNLPTQIICYSCSALPIKCKWCILKALIRAYMIENTMSYETLSLVLSDFPNTCTYV
jgi:hypothetical protein